MYSISVSLSLSRSLSMPGIEHHGVVQRLASFICVRPHQSTSCCSFNLPLHLSATSTHSPLWTPCMLFTNKSWSSLPESELQLSQRYQKISFIFNLFYNIYIYIQYIRAIPELRNILRTQDQCKQYCIYNIVMVEITENFRKKCECSFLGTFSKTAHPCLERLMEKGRNSPEMWKRGMLLCLTPYTLSGRLQRNDT